MFFTSPYIFSHPQNSLFYHMSFKESGNGNSHWMSFYFLLTITRIFKLSAAVRRWLPHCHSHVMLYVFNLKLVVGRVSFISDNYDKIIAFDRRHLCEPYF
jgi:hypothetical protein